MSNKKTLTYILLSIIVIITSLLLFYRSTNNPSLDKILVEEYRDRNHENPESSFLFEAANFTPLNKDHPGETKNFPYLEELNLLFPEQLESIITLNPKVINIEDNPNKRRVLIKFALRTESQTDFIRLTDRKERKLDNNKFFVSTEYQDFSGVYVYRLRSVNLFDIDNQPHSLNTDCVSSIIKPEELIKICNHIADNINLDSLPKVDLDEE